MPAVGPRAEDTDTAMIADLIRRVRRLEKRTIPAGSNTGQSLVLQGIVDGSSSGIQSCPELDVGTGWSQVVPLVGPSGAGGNITVLIQDTSGNGYDVVLATLLVIDPITGDWATATAPLSPVPTSGAWPPTPWTNNGSSGSTFAFTGGQWTRVAAGPVVGWCEVGFDRTS